MTEVIAQRRVHRLTSAAGLTVEINANGSVRRFDCGTVSLALFLGNELEGGPANLYLRRLSHSDNPEPLEWTALLGPRSATLFQTDAAGTLHGSGSWRGLRYVISLVLAQHSPAWFWHVQLTNTTDSAQAFDLTYVQDVALAEYGAIRMNEYYVSQYLDHTPLAHALHGAVICSRQNQAIQGRFPWSLIGSLRTARSFATDALQFFGLAGRSASAPPGLRAELPSRRLQHEHSMVVLRDAALTVLPGQSAAGGFCGAYVADHPAATSTQDLAQLDKALALAEAVPPSTRIEAETTAEQSATLFSTAPVLAVQELEDHALRELFPGRWRHEEIDEHGKRLSFFLSADRHIVLRAKEQRVLRPHGQLLRSGLHVTPDESALTSTVWMSGVFHSMVTQGHVSINRLLSTVHSYLGLFHTQGLRVFVEIAGAWQLLDLPSAFEMSPQRCRWIYAHERGRIEVLAEAHSDPHALSISIQTGAAAMRCLLVHHVALNGDDGALPGPVLWWREREDIVLAPVVGSELAGRFPDGCFRLRPLPDTRIEAVRGDELLFLDERSRGQPYLCCVLAPAASVGLRIEGELIRHQACSPQRVATVAALSPVVSLRAPAGSALADEAARLADIVPWLAQNALVHYLSPRGLEQYSGGGWGTRDVCQGPVEMLLALGRSTPIRDILLRVMAQQNPDGDWPQWFMFFERERAVRAGDSHGDIVFWPLLVLAQYLIASGDVSVLEERVPLYGPRGGQAAEPISLWAHVQRALALIEQRVIKGTKLAAYGHGDWNDSLQPADPRMREQLCSAWTVTLHVQTLRSLAAALCSIDRAQDAVALEQWAQAVQADFQRLLLVDGVLAGYALFDEKAGVHLLLHPRDHMTGLRYSALAMIHAILEGMLTPEQAREHVRLIESHLSAPDGARLFDRPMAYHGGPQRIFQRAESATFFGREIGLMYTHAHLRYAQALAHLGEPERFFRALCQANPIGVRSVVPNATLRQSNCYFSSSDAQFHDRYEASEQYERVIRGNIAVDGGWRVYSSGAGIALGLVLRRFLGLSFEAQALHLDPVMPAALDGLQVQLTLQSRHLDIRYRVGAAGCGVNAIQLNGQSLTFAQANNPYRRGAVRVAAAELHDKWVDGLNRFTIELG